MARASRGLRYAWIVLFVPTSSLLAGILAYLMSLSAPGSGGNGLSDVIRGYAPFWPGTYGVRHIPSLILSLAVLFLLDVSRRARKPIVTLFQIRVILLVLIALLTIVFKVFSVVWPLDVASRATMEEAQALFIYADLDLCLIFLLTFLPAFRRSPSRLI